jgi:hypothetical protein
MSIPLLLVGTYDHGTIIQLGFVGQEFHVLYEASGNPKLNAIVHQLPGSSTGIDMARPDIRQQG